jgi:hypothetical protein
MDKTRPSAATRSTPGNRNMNQFGFVGKPSEISRCFDPRHSFFGLLTGVFGLRALDAICRVNICRAMRTRAIIFLASLKGVGRCFPRAMASVLGSLS